LNWNILRKRSVVTVARFGQLALLEFMRVTGSEFVDVGLRRLGYKKILEKFVSPLNEAKLRATVGRNGTG